MSILDALKAQRENIEAVLVERAVLDGAPATLSEAIQHALMAGGKRLRPLLVMQWAEAMGDVDDAVPAAVAVEMVHTYSLIHDDLPALDDDELRRGKPTVHVAFDEATAILAGDALLTDAFAHLATTESDNAALMCFELARAAGSTGMVGGQVRDLAAEKSAVDEQELLLIHLGKTAALLAASCALGVLAAGDLSQLATQQALDDARAYGTELGLAFQIAGRCSRRGGRQRCARKERGQRRGPRKAHLRSRLRYRRRTRARERTRRTRGRHRRPLRPHPRHPLGGPRALRGRPRGVSASRALRARALARPRETIASLLQRRSFDPAVSAQLDVLVEDLDLRGLRNLDRGLRELDIGHASWLHGRTGIGPAACLSMVRNGYLREAALERLLSSRTPRAHAFIALRLSDPVRNIRANADRALSTSLPGNLLIEALVVTERLRRSVYRWEPFVEGLRAALDDEALQAGTRSTQIAVRDVCNRVLLERESGDALLARIGGILEDERTPDIRRFAASRAKGEVLDQLLLRFEVDRAPEIRRMAVRARAARGDSDDKDALLRMCFDRDSTARHLARMGLARHGGAVDLRGRARRILDDEGSPLGELIGALSVLADLGRRDDIERVTPFATRDGALGREAVRTLAILGSL